MTNDQIIAFRDLVGRDRIAMFTDNVKLYNERNEGEHLIWDDANTCFYCIRVSANNKSNDTLPVSVQTTGYDQIQYMSAVMTVDDLREILTTLKSKGIDLDVGDIVNEMEDIINYKV